jgi:hypothetical protein
MSTNDRVILILKTDSGGVVSLALLVIPEKSESNPADLYEQLG